MEAAVLKEMVMQCLDDDPDQRPPIQQVSKMIKSLKVCTCMHAKYAIMVSCMQLLHACMHACVRSLYMSSSCHLVAIMQFHSLYMHACIATCIASYNSAVIHPALIN